MNMSMNMNMNMHVKQVEQLIIYCLCMYVHYKEKEKRTVSPQFARNKQMMQNYLCVQHFTREISYHALDIHSSIHTHIRKTLRHTVCQYIN